MGGGSNKVADMGSNGTGAAGSDAALTGSNSKYISKKLCYVLGLLAVVTCVAVGLIVYFAGVAGQCAASSFDSGHEGENSVKPKVTDVRLPTHAVPLRYKVQLVPFLVAGNYTIRGYVRITFRCDSAARNVTLHVADMTLNNDTIVVSEEASGTQLSIIKHAYDAEREFYIAHLDSDLKPNATYNIQIWFTAKLADSLKGFYRSVYKNEKGEEVLMAVTQFQATDARRAFPCFDEPALKATFEVSLGRLKNMSSISNMPIAEGQQGVPMEGTIDYVWDHFKESVPMSTYLVAFVVSDFDHEPAPPTGNNVEFRIWARRNAIDQIAYAQSIGAKILAYFEKYFNVKYPLPKQDMIAIPDFSAGAMENWGLITYRESALLYSDNVSALANKQKIAIVISHELAHQWFGNLVTPSWWSDLWLNEGFASYVEYLGVEAVAPEMKLLQQFVVNDMQAVMRVDALETSHPISIQVKHPDEIAEIFDSISYSKGATIIRMMDHFLKTDTFRRGLTNYLNKFKYKAAEQDDLWRELTAQAHADSTLPKNMTVKAIMDTWTLQMGFPVITVTRNYESNTAELQQDRFLLLRSKNSSSDSHEYRWWVPITFTTPGGNFDDTFNRVWMAPTDKTKTISQLPSKDKAVIFNVQETGYYRVNYDTRNWQLLIDQLNANHESIHVTNRAQIIDDALNLAVAGLLDYRLALAVTSYMHKEKEYIAWDAALSGLTHIDIMLSRTAAYGEFKRYMLSLVLPLYNRLGYADSVGDEYLNVILRTRAVGWACKLGLSQCSDKIKQDFASWRNHPEPDAQDANKINVNLKSTVYCNALEYGDEAEWDFLWQRYLKSNVGTEKDSMLGSLGCTKQIWLLNRYLNMSLTEGSGVRKQDGSYVLGSVASNVFGRDLAFDFARSKWDVILEYYAGSSFSIAGIAKNVLKNRNTRFELEEVKLFQKVNAGKLSSAEREVRQAIEKATTNVEWMDNNYETVFKWLKEQNSAVKKF